MSLLSVEPSGRRYKPETVRDALDLSLRSRNCYSATLPNPKMLKSYFGEFGSSGSIQECTATVRSVFSNLSDMQLYCEVLIDEIHIKPSIRYRGNHIISNSVDHFSPNGVLYDGRAIICGQINSCAYPYAWIFTRTNWTIAGIIHDCGGFVFMVMTDNLRCNQSMFKAFHEKYGTANEWSINHPVPNPHFLILFMLYDPTHLLKNVRNNWVTEKTQILLFPDSDTGKMIEARWRDLIELYKEETEYDQVIFIITF